MPDQNRRRFELVFAGAQPTDQFSDPLDRPVAVVRMGLARILRTQTGFLPCFHSLTFLLPRPVGVHAG
jgi:hypothetical protein